MRSVLSRLTSGGQRGNDLVFCFGGPLLDLLGPQSAQRMSDDHWLEPVSTQHTGVELSGV